MTIEKLPSGKWRIKQMIKGKYISVTVPYKPSDKKAFDLIQAERNHIVDNSMNFETAAGQYLAVKKRVLSPSTLRGYEVMQKGIPEWFNRLDIFQIGNYEMQKVISEYAIDHSPKSTSNLYGFIRAVIRLFIPEVAYSITLPQKVRKEPYTPSVDDVKSILKAADGTPYYVPIYLAMLSLRNSEICALTIFDLKDDMLTINKAKVRGSDGYVVKPTAKTDKSNRTIRIPHALAERIRQQGYIYEGYPLQIDKFLTRTQKELKIPHFGVHRLRHFFASYSHEQGYSDAVIQAVGGWSSDHVMKSVYRHALNKDEAIAKIASDFDF